MTRETKIGLLVGLAFIIVIGILLSDQRRSAMEPPAAPLSNVGASVRETVASAGAGNPPITIVTPQNAQPRSSVPTQRELNPVRFPVIPITPTGPDNRQARDPQPAPRAQDPQGAIAEGPSTLVQQHPGELTNLDGNNSPRGNDTPSTSAPQPVANVKTYKAQAGDSVSRMASKFLGSNTKTNRQLIIDANPSLQSDPNNVIIGKTYSIPTPGSVAAAQPSPAAPTPAPAPTAAPGEYFYTVEQGDTLWAIANDELGDASAVDAIKELNKSVLKGENHDVVRPGMKLRLPGKPLASAN